MRGSRRWILLLVGLSLIVLIALADLIWSFTSGAPPYELPADAAARPVPVRFRTSAEHDAVRAAHPEPYVLELKAPGGGALCYFGAHHTRDPADPQRRAIEERWTSFRPTVALCEGRARRHLVGWPWLDLVPQGEPAWVHALARRNGVPLWSLEPGYRDEVAAMLRVGTPEQVALCLSLRVYWSENEGLADEALFLDLLRKRSDVDGLRGAVPDLAAADAVWAALREQHGDWRTLRDRPAGTFLDGLSDASVAARGEHMVRLLLHLVGRGERVFAVVGSGHVIRQEWALRTALGAEPAPDQPR